MHESFFFVVFLYEYRRYSTGGLAFVKNKDSGTSNQFIESLSLSNYMRYVIH